MYLNLIIQDGQLLIECEFLTVPFDLFELPSSRNNLVYKYVNIILYDEFDNQYMNYG
jgi:hypothetical protein